MSRTFHLGDVLTVTTGGRLVSPRGMEGVYDILRHMIGGPVLTHQIPRIIGESRPCILTQHPDLASVQVPAEFRDEAHVWEWLAEQVDRFGPERDIAPLPPEDHTHIDPMAELRMMAPHMQVIAVEAEEDVP